MTTYAQPEETLTACPYCGRSCALRKLNGGTYALIDINGQPHAPNCVAAGPVRTALAPKPFRR